MNQVSPKDISWKDLDSLVAKRSRLRSGDEVIAISSQTKKPYLARISDIIGRSNPEKKAEQQVGRLRSNLDRMLEDAVTKGETIIKGGYIETDLINVDELFAKNASITNTLTMGEDGEITNVGEDYSLTKDGLLFKTGETYLINRAVKWEDLQGEQIRFYSLHNNSTGDALKSVLEYTGGISGVILDLINMGMTVEGTLNASGPLNATDIFRASRLMAFSDQVVDISSDTLDLSTIKTSLVRVSSESGSTDDLSTIQVDGATPGENYLLMLIANSGETITINDGSGNIVTNVGNIQMDDSTLLMMVYVNNDWHLIQDN